MKKLMVLATIAAMALDAKAEYTIAISSLDLDIYPGLYFKDNYNDYFYLEATINAHTVSATAFNTVPEPTSGLLLLLGMAGLALKRKANG